MAKSILGTQASRKFAVLALSTTALAVPGVAMADGCVASSTNSASISCTGSASSYTYTGTAPATVSVASGAAVTAPLAISVAGSTLTNAGTISNTTSVFGVQMGDGVTGTPTVLNSGAITSTGTGGAISVGNSATVENAGTLTAAAGTAAVSFGTNGTFTNDSTATAAITGNIVFGTNIGSNTATFTNNSATYGLTGSVTATGNINATNAGIYTGNFTQAAASGTTAVSFKNTAGGIFTGILYTGNSATITNTGATTATSSTASVASTMYLYSGSAIGYYDYTGGSGTSLLSNDALLYIGTTSAPLQLDIAGNFTQSKTGTTYFAIAPAGTSTNTAGTTYSQINATGTATLAGNVTLNVQPGFYATGSKYDIVVAKGGITNTATVTAQSTSSTPLIFVTFDSGKLVNSNTTLEVTATHVSDYAAALKTALTGTTTPITTNQYTVAKALNPLIGLANASSTSNQATLLGDFDILTATEAQTFLDSLSPEGYLAYGTALRDQANAFARSIDLRMQDQNSNHDEDGWWGNINGQFQFNTSAFNSDGLNRSKSSMYGINLGYDFSGPTHVYGLAVSLNWDKLKLATGSMTGNNRDLAIAAYGAKNLGPLRISGQLAYNYGHLSATKTLNLSSTTATASGRTGEYMFKATGQLGIDLHAGGYLIEPFVGIDYNKGQINSFTESSSFGNGVADLNVYTIKADHTDALFGASIARDHGKLRPYAKVLYRERLSGSAMNLVTAALTGDTSTATPVPFSVIGTGTHKGEINANAGVNWVFDDAGSLFFGYQGTMRKGLQSHGFNMGIRIEF